MPIKNFTTTGTTFSIVYDGLNQGTWDRLDELDSKYDVDVRDSSATLSLRNPGFSDTLTASDSLQVNGVELTGTFREKIEAIKNVVLYKAGPGSALPTEYPATYAAMQASITSDPTTKRDFFVTADGIWYRYDGTNIGRFSNVLPVHSYLVGFGDSITSFLTTSISNIQIGSNSFVGWANILAGSPFSYPIGFNKGVGGDTTTQMLARISTVTALKPSVVTVLGGTNDLGNNATAADIINNLKLIYATLVSNNCKVVAVTILPRFGGSALSQAKETVRNDVNTWILSQSSDMVYPVNGNSMDSSMFDDGLHPNTKGGYYLGGLVATVFKKLCPLSTSPAFILNDDNSYTNNGSMSGTSGIAEGGTTGQVADTYTLYGSLSGGATVAGSKTTDANNLKQQLITISGNYTGSPAGVFFRSDRNNPTGVYNGDIIEGLIEFEVIGTLQNIINVSLNVYIDSSGGGYIDSYSMYNVSTDDSPIVPGKYTMRTPPLKISTSAPITSIQSIFKITQRSAGAGSLPISGQFKINKITVRKAIPNATPYVLKTASYAVTANDYVIDATGTNTVTLPTSVGIAGKIYVIKNSGTGVITVATTSSQTIDGAASYSLASQYKYVTVQSNGTNWIIIGNN